MTSSQAYRTIHPKTPTDNSSSPTYSPLLTGKAISLKSPSSTAKSYPTDRELLHHWSHDHSPIDLGSGYISVSPGRQESMEEVCVCKADQCLTEISRVRGNPIELACSPTNRLALRWGHNNQPINRSSDRHCG